MKQTIRWAALLLAGALIFAFAACGEKDNDPGASVSSSVNGGEAAYTEPTEPTVLPVVNDPNAWRLEVRGGNISEFTSNDAKYQTLYQNLSMTVTDVNYGVTTTHQYTGITLKSILEFVGVPPYRVQSVTVTSVTGKSVNYSAALALDETTLLAWEEDGAPIQTNPPLKMCPKNGSLENYVDLCASITIQTLAPGQTLPGQQPAEDDPLQPTSPTTTTRNRWTLGTVAYPTLSSQYSPITTKKTTTRTTAATTRTTGVGTTLPGNSVSTTQPSGTTVPTTSGATGSGSSSSSSTASSSSSTTSSTGTTKYTYTTRPTTTKAPTTTTAPPTTAAPTTSAKTTHTYPPGYDDEQKSRYDEANGLKPNGQ
ncbi:MAG: hypothetical protein LBS96_00360 [Oscillospiraceae bacterium]|jgi:hypothetical protein|nr:hypothetical protein [Oscillospiraceae bacterium]